jgi:SOS regulatory protein LexA
MSNDLDYLTQLQDYYATQGALPSYARIGELVGLRSKASVSALIDRLVEAGLIQRTPDRRLAPSPNFFARPVIDTVRAGLPQAANDAGQRSIAIDSYLVPKPSRSVLLSVKGDSMQDAGLMEGDHLVVDRGAPAQVGDIVVAIVDNQFTVKYLAQDTRGFYLKPANIAYAPIRPEQQLEIYGVVTGSFRRY